MGRAIDLFVTYRFIKLLTTPFEKTDAFKMGIIDKDGKKNPDFNTNSTHGTIGNIKPLL